jgi:hypothetical protein
VAPGRIVLCDRREPSPPRPSTLALWLAAAATALVSGCDRARPTRPTPADALESAFAEAQLSAPLGIPSRPWETDRQGFNNGGAGLSLTVYSRIIPAF